MTFKTIDDYKLALADNPYFEGRWPHFVKVINIIKEIKPKNILEIGANGFCLCEESTKLDIDQSIDADIYWDITKIPWPIDEKKFDLVIALQVWEHLGDKQREAFIEMRRVTKNAILSYPYKWKSGDSEHLNITKDIIKFWTLDEEYLLERIVKSPKRDKDRIIYWYEF